MFDPYHKWLGIRKEQQPPTFYQLLGISPDEKDPEVIEEAAIRQTTHVRTYQIGPHAAECTRVLNEIAQARITLLNPAKRASYDAELRREAAPSDAAPLWEPEDAPSPPMMEVDEGEPLGIAPVRISFAQRSKKKWVIGATIGGAFHLIGGAILIWFIFLRPKNNDEQNPADDRPQVVRNDSNKVQNEPRNGPQTTRQTKTDNKPETKRDTKKESVKIIPDGQANRKPPPPREVALAPGELRRFEKQPDAISLVAFAGEGKRAVWITRSGNMVLVDLETGQEIVRFANAVNNTRVMAFSPDGSRLLFENATRNMVLIDTETGVEVRQFERHTRFADAMAVSADGKQALTTAGPFTRMVTLWNMETGKKARELQPNGEGAVRNSNGKNLIAFSPEGRRFLVIFGDNTLRLWELFTGTEIRRYEGELRGVNCLAFSPNGRHAVTGHFDRSMRLWDVSTLTEVGRFEGHRGSIMSVAFAPNGLHVLSGSSDRSVRLWEVATRREVVQFDAHQDTVNCVAFSPDGRHGLSGSQDKSVRVWELPISADIASKPAEIDPEADKATKVAGQEKQPIPDEAALAKAKQEIREKYKGKFALTKPGEKITLAEELFQLGINAVEGADRYMAFLEGIELAIQVGNVATVINAVDSLGKGFTIDILDMKAAALERIAKTASEIGSRTVTDSALNLVNEAMDADNFAMAERCMSLAATAAKAAKSPAVDKKVEVRSKELEEAKNDYQKVAKALAVLKDKAQDPEANLAVGKHYCFKRGEWKKGLAMLVLAADAQIRELARKDLAQPRDANVQVEVADGWWELAQRETGKVKTNLLTRARYWYEEAESTADGIAKTKVEERLKELDKLMPSGPQVRPGSFYARIGPLKAQLLRDGGGSERSEAAVAAGLKWISRHQAKDGHWSLDRFHIHGGCTCTGAGSHNDIAGTALALLPLLGAGETHKRGPYAKTIERGLQFLLVKQNRNGFFGGDHYGHAMATTAVCEAYGLTGDAPLRKPAIAALNYILAAQSDNGGWRYAPRAGGDTSVTGWQVMALKTGWMAGFKVPAKTFTEARKWLDSCMFNDGSGYGYLSSNDGTPATSAIGLLLRQYLGWEYRHPGLRAGISRLKSMPPELSNNQYYNYYATQVMYHMGGEAWDFWNPRMRDLLINTQDKGDPRNPHQGGSWDPKGDPYGFSGGRLMITSLSLLNLEIYYRYIPLYRRGAVVMKD
jgi:WD40 repeat protein